MLSVPPAKPSRSRKKKLKKEELAMVISVVATVLVIVQRFFIDSHLLLLPPSQTMALEASIEATNLALSKLKTMLSIAQVVSLAQLEGAGSQCVEEEAPARIRKSWFETFLGSKTSDDVQWRQNFRMSRAVFFTLLEILQPALDMEDDTMKSMHPEWQLGAALYRLAHGATFKAVSRRFGIGTSSSCKAFYDVCKALQCSLNHLFDFPASAEGLNPIIQGFSAQGMPNCCGVIGCTQFPLEKPPLDEGLSTAMEYYDQNGTYSVSMQAVVDTTGRFMDISVGWGGSFSPGAILPRTRLFARVEESRELLHGPPVELINRILIPEYIIGDQSYPLLPWLITPYLSSQKSTSQLLFNSVHEFLRGAATKAFGVLKSQWQLLSTQQRVENLEFLPFIVAAACILHNFCISSGEPMPDVQEVNRTEAYGGAAERHEYAESIRDALADHVSTVARMQFDLH